MNRVFDSRGCKGIFIGTEFEFSFTVYIGIYPFDEC